MINQNNKAITAVFLTILAINLAYLILKLGDHYFGWKIYNEYLYLGPVVNNIATGFVFFSTLIFIIYSIRSFTKRIFDVVLLLSLIDIGLFIWHAYKEAF